MTKSDLVVLLCLILASGCSLFDSADVGTDQQSAPPAITESKAEPVPASLETVPVETPIAAPRTFTRADMRRMQLRLREVGLDPGPIDGIAGAKTGAAFDRFQNGCTSANAVIQEWGSAGSQPLPIEAKMPNRQDTQTIQAQLRKAGFNPGPIDGIFGSKTRSVLAELKNSCSMIAEFTQMLDQTAVQAGRSANTLQAAQNNVGGFQVSRVLTRSDANKQSLSALPAPSQEEIRILQLRLRDAGFDPGPFDGIMGPRTRSALQQYQASRKGKATKLISGFDGQY